PKTINKLQRQAETIRQCLKRRTESPPSPTNTAINQLVKCAELAMYQAEILSDQVTQLQAAVQRQKKKRGTRRSYIRSDTILTGAEGQSQVVARGGSQVAGADGDANVVGTASNSRRCGRCKEIGHSSRTC
ncbi:hypothetical protein V1525DRAFT_322391, partial [Lipomyces kononenkoae]